MTTGTAGVALMTSSGSLVAMSPSRPIIPSPARRCGRSVSQRQGRHSPAQRCQALEDARDSVGVAEDFQGEQLSIPVDQVL